MTEKERMISGELYMASDTELDNGRTHARKITRLFNQTTEEQNAYRVELLKKLFETTGEKLYIEPPFRCDYGYNISTGENFYANFDCIILDVCKVSIGDNVLFGPRVSIYTAAHPIDAQVRNTLLEFGKPVTIGNNVWIGGNVVINPGITIGNNVVIGSGSIVTKNIPDNVIAAGNPCKIVREINRNDARYWEEKQNEYTNKN
ncbi:MAG: sugar O-acetyltransferase [Bacteroidales bacterium]|jgi:maltose O-acetyltransferase|nr:sugar O-acetyltransferase [Bacteroidales bacterium]